METEREERLLQDSKLGIRNSKFNFFNLVYQEWMIVFVNASVPIFIGMYREHKS